MAPQITTMLDILNSVGVSGCF